MKAMSWQTCRNIDFEGFLAIISHQGVYLKTLTLAVSFLILAAINCGGKKQEVSAEEPLRPVPDGMVLVPGGYFTMGSDTADESPKHKVWVDSFYMDKCEVTNRQYLEFVKATGHNKPAFSRDTSLNKPNQPVVGVSYFDALCYVIWAGKRLPTEAEWEYAARGGLDGMDFPWGNDPPIRRCNYWPAGNPEADGHKYSSAVGRFPANNYGLFDMSGNAWEWCADLYDSAYYAISPEKNPAGPDSGYFRVLRGGSWLSINPTHLRCSSRLALKPFVQDRYYGFRCAASLRR
jgi:iron(II)-dependent oxidoreductase